MRPFSRKPAATNQLPSQDFAVLFCAKKWNFFLDQHKFPDDLPLADQMVRFTARMRETLLVEVPELGSLTEAELQSYVHRGIVSSGLTTQADLDQALNASQPAK